MHSAAESIDALQSHLQARLRCPMSFMHATFVCLLRFQVWPLVLLQSSLPVLCCNKLYLYMSSHPSAESEVLACLKLCFPDLDVLNLTIVQRANLLEDLEKLQARAEAEGRLLCLSLVLLLTRSLSRR